MVSFICGSQVQIFRFFCLNWRPIEARKVEWRNWEEGKILRNELRGMNKKEDCGGGVNGERERWGDG